MSGWIAGYEPVIVDITRDYSSGPNGGKSSNGDATKNRGVRAEAGSLPDERGHDGPVGRTGSGYEVVGEDDGRADEDITLELDPGVNRHVVLNAAPVADNGAIVNVHILAQHAVSTHPGSRPDMGMMPDNCAATDLGIWFHYGRFMGPIIRCERFVHDQPASVGDAVFWSWEPHSAQCRRLSELGEARIDPIDYLKHWSAATDDEKR